MNFDFTDDQQAIKRTANELLAARFKPERVRELAVDILGEDGAAWDSRWTYRLLRSRANSIEGGTTEILKNIIAERVLGLPKLR